MKLEKLKIKGFRKLKNITLDFKDASFLIGENNIGKSSILRALELLLTMNTANEADYTKRKNSGSGEIERIENEIVLIGIFTDVPEVADSWIGFKGRIFIENGKRKIKYRKTFSDSGTIYEIWEQKKELKEDLTRGNKIYIESIIESGIDEEKVSSHFKGIDTKTNLNVNKHKDLLNSFPDVWDYEEEFDWIKNPGGIPQNVISKLPKFVLIPAEHRADEIDSNKKTALGEIMSTIFDDIVEKSKNFEKVKQYFGELENEIDTENTKTEFGELMVEVNKTIKNIFPDSELLAKVNLSDPSTFLKPKYDIKLGSNILTDVSYQGTGMIRSTAFSLLKFREDWKKTREQKDLRNLIIGFEEPELFLHPNASNQMRDTIYELAGTSNQIICTSHSPYMIDLSRENEKQIINNLSIDEDTFVRSTSFSVTDKFLELLEGEKHYVKMLIKLDDYFARAFFAKKILIVEGDTEDVVLRKSISLLNKDDRNKIKSDYQFIKARGKATIPPLVKYFKSLGIDNIFIIHDRDSGTEKAEAVNPRILEVINSEEERVMLEECIEDVLGYDAPSKDKPYKAYIETNEWMTENDIPEEWMRILRIAFEGYIEIKEEVNV